MSARILANCRWCEEGSKLFLEPKAVHLVYYVHNPENSFYTFDCPHCEQENKKEANSTVIAMLLSVAGSGGVKLTRVESEKHAGGPALTTDDLLDLIQDLKNWEAGAHDCE